MTTPTPPMGPSTPGRAAGIALAVLVAGSCAPPDRPARLPPPLPEAAELLLEPTERLRVWVGPGIWYRSLRSGAGPWAVHLLEVELGRCELGLGVARAADEEEKKGGHATVSRMVGDWSADTVAAVNGDFFTPEGTPLGPELVDGRFRTPRGRASLAWWPGSTPWMGTVEPTGDGAVRAGRHLPGGLEGAAVISGRPLLLDEGRRVGDLMTEDNPTFAARRHPRTAVAWDPDRGRLWLVVVDGRQPGYSEGMTLPELATLVEGLGAHEALNLDGGGSSAMVIRGRPVNRPSDEAGERGVVNALVLYRDPGLCAREVGSSIR